jgi:integrase
MSVELGIRLSELLRLRWKDIDWSKGTIAIYHEKNDQRKDDEDDYGRTAPLTYIVRMALGKMIADDYRLSKQYANHTYKGKIFGTWTTRGLTNAWQVLRKKANIKPRLGWHCLRHEAISRFNTFLTPLELTAVVGHIPLHKEEHTKVTKGYIHPDYDFLEKIADKINAFTVKSFMTDMYNDGKLNTKRWVAVKGE